MNPGGVEADVTAHVVWFEVVAVWSKVHFAFAGHFFLTLYLGIANGCGFYVTYILNSGLICILNRYVAQKEKQRC